MKKVTRRQFLRTSVLAGAGAALAGMGEAEALEETAHTVEVTKINQYRPRNAEERAKDRAQMRALGICGSQGKSCDLVCGECTIYGKSLANYMRWKEQIYLEEK